MAKLLTIDEQLTIEIALRLYMDSILDSPIQYHKESVKTIEQLLKKLKGHRLSFVGVVI